MGIFLDKKEKLAVEAVYRFAGPQARLKHELDLLQTGNVLKYLQAGADINTTNKYGHTPLTEAALLNDPKELKILFKHLKPGKTVVIIQPMARPSY